MELLSPAGSVEKLKYVYQYGADAAYIGLDHFSLRARADNFDADHVSLIKDYKGDKKLYCALNIFFRNDAMERLKKELDNIARFPFDAFIVSDPGAFGVLKGRFPGTSLHLSTQANCINAESAKFYRDCGVSRIILGREASLDDIEKIKNAVPDVEIEVFVHGAMCLAYSGRCFLSRWMSNRSANEGSCAHSCRWKYRYLEEGERPGEYYPVIEGDDFTTILSSRDLCMIDYLDKLKNIGVDSIKIEGRMKSLYYAAIVTRAYRKMLDTLDGKPVPEMDSYREDLFEVSHREYSTGFYFDNEEIELPTEKSYERKYRFLGVVGENSGEGLFILEPKNQILAGEEIEFIGPNTPVLRDDQFTLYNDKNEVVLKADHGKNYLLKSAVNIEPGYIIRVKTATP